MVEQVIRKVPARYRGDHAVRLPPLHGPYFDGSGKRLESFLLSPGDTLMVWEQEVKGQTFLLNDNGAEWLGYGHVVKPEHQEALAGKSEQEQAEILSALRYQFHSPRSDFQALESEAIPGPPAQAPQGESVSVPTNPTSDQAVSGASGSDTETSASSGGVESEGVVA